MSRKIAFQGEPGAYSDLACRTAYPGVTTLPCTTFEAAIEADTEIDDHRQGARAIGGPVHVEHVLGDAAVGVGTIAHRLDAVALRTRLRVQLTDGGDAAEEVVDHERAHP